MPTYQYACTECGQQLEAVQSFSDQALTECPNCGGKLRKVFNSVGIVFKGSGFYRNDSRPGGGSPDKAGTKTDSTSESTPATTNASTTTDGGSSKTTATTGSSSTTTSSSGSSTTSSSGGTKAGAASS